ncbi:MAG TPA: hypothetical protein VI815_00455 [Candidatus Nanoarchaeia archaeon]|nr:hypothetical protein [Candidatus Nanoarchaeia archaeon]
MKIKKLENPQMTGLRIALFAISLSLLGSALSLWAPMVNQFIVNLIGIALLIMAIIILLCGIELKNN